MEVTKYTIGVSYDFDKNSVKSVDRAMKSLEKKIKDFSKKFGSSFAFDIGRFRVNETRLIKAVGEAFDRASARTVFEITRFSVNERNLQAAMLRASRRAATAVPINISTPQSRVVNNNARERLREDVSARSTPVRSRVGVGAGLSLSRLYGPALGLAAGGYGLSKLNQRNQQVVAAQLQTNAVIQQAGGTAEQGGVAFDWLRAQGNRIGFNYLDASGDFNNLLSGLTGAGYSVSQSQDVYKGFAELSRTNKLDRVRQQRVFRALAQVAGKGKLQAEELTGQLAESLPGAVSLFAQAYQRQTGGNLSGQEAVAALQKAMKKGQVNSGVLTYASQIASERAAPALEAAGHASQAEQARFQNAITDQSVIASQNGVEEGFARLFRALATGLNESSGLTKGLAEAFNEATKMADKLITFPQSFTRALEGRDSLIADWLGADQTKELQTSWVIIRDAIKDILQSPSPSWMPTLQSTARELSALITAAGGTIQRFKENGSVADQIQRDSIDQYSKNPYGGATIGKVVGLAKANWYTFKSSIGAINPWDDTDYYADYWRQRDGFNGNAQAWRTQNAIDIQNTANSVFGSEGLGISKSNAPSNMNNYNTFDINVMLQTDNTSEFERMFQEQFQPSLERALDKSLDKFSYNTN